MPCAIRRRRESELRPVDRLLEGSARRRHKLQKAGRKQAKRGPSDAICVLHPFVLTQLR
jgi:hypothetical protein